MSVKILRGEDVPIRQIIVRGPDLPEVLEIAAGILKGQPSKYKTEVISLIWDQRDGEWDFTVYVKIPTKG
ncbi:MAG: hypothetical protein BroJett011_33850 [Chloroflexota bacterium]|nr:MAG: hypothetical protein BroJett011_33850 [Chloroflexota bacterium]